MSEQWADPLQDSGNTLGFKADVGKPRLDLVPSAGIRSAFAGIRRWLPDHPSRDKYTWWGRAVWELSHFYDPDSYRQVAPLMCLDNALGALMVLMELDADRLGILVEVNPVTPQNEWAAIPAQPLLDIAAGFTYGHKKYSLLEEPYANNWLQGMRFGRPYAAAMRHLMAWRSGETNDPESGLSHCAHAGCNLMMLAHYTSLGMGERYEQYDDRPVATRIESYSKEYAQARDAKKVELVKKQGEADATP